MAARTHQTPSGGRTNGASHFTHRGGIQKRGQQTVRVDRDGDLDMDSNGVGRGRGRGRGTDHRHNTSKPYTNGHGDLFRDTRRNRVDLSAAQKGVFRAMGDANAIPKGPRASSRFTNNSSQRFGGTDRLATGPLDQILIRGLGQSKAATNADGGLESLISWLERKATGSNGEAVEVKKSRRNGDDVIVSVRPEDIASIIRINNYQFAGANLLIELYQHGATAATKDTTISAEAAEVKALFTNVLARRYNQELKLLDLSRLGEDPDLVSNGLFDTNSRIAKLFPALMGVCNEAFESEQAKTDAVASISLANNNLINLESVSILAETFPNIKNLDLSDNKFKNVHSLEKWRFKFTKLEQIVLTGNPIETNDPEFGQVLMKRFPNLRTIGTTPDRPKGETKNPKGTQTSITIAPAIFQDEGNIGQSFLLRFFPAYDADRDSLLRDYYDDKATFSINVNTQAPREQATSTSAARWDDYIKVSRNLLRINHAKARANRLHQGLEEILPVWRNLPATRHPDMISEGEKWSVECQSLPGVPHGQTVGGVGGLIITVHGEFSEADGKKRSFDRTFILGPGAGAGGVRVVSDMLTLRSYGGYGTFKSNTPNNAPAGIPVQAPQIQNATSPNAVQQSNPDPALPQAQNLALPEGFGLRMDGKSEEQVLKEIMAIELTGRTRMTIEYSGLCLSESEWNLEKAYQAFEGAKGTLPQEAFLPF